MGCARGRGGLLDAAACGTSLRNRSKKTKASTDTKEQKRRNRHLFRVKKLNTANAVFGHIEIKRRRRRRDIANIARFSSFCVCVRSARTATRMNALVVGCYVNSVSYGRGGPQGPRNTSVPPCATGPQGSIGVQGAQGLRGESVVGPQGPQGSVGNSVVGPQGVQGPHGSSTAGPQGPQGKSTPGPQGAQGPRGDSITGTQGPMGAQGDSITGPQGPQGASCLGLQGPQGPYGPSTVGTQGPQGYQGPSGTGPQGPQGRTVVGPQGSQGPQGVSVTGTQGPQGTQGPSIIGPQGSQGESVVGPQGVQGPQGIPGPALNASVLLTPINGVNYWLSSEGLVVQTQGLTGTGVNPVGAFNGSGTGNKSLVEVNNPTLPARR